MEIIVEGNIESYQLSQKLQNLKIILEGNFSTSSNNKSPIRLYYGLSQKYDWNNINDFFNFSQKVRGLSMERLALEFQFLSKDQGFSENFLIKNSLELGLLKSLFSIYSWIENYLTSTNLEGLKKSIYNEFIIDYTGRPEPQKDIYFISEKYLTTKNRPHILRLKALNLLNSITFNYDKGQYESFFIPFIKPGVTRDLFKGNEFDLNGSITYELWKSILEDRDFRIRYWINNRF
ncbi:hypothetical protein ACFFGT_21375 [Mucilaginibacter angelicae]|uniref:Uncharacterized protein n=1 Tax=Mucilaginibacter angelicae TaxID=869718 RepID=A0ABV6LBB0_9SPHI